MGIPRRSATVRRVVLALPALPALAALTAASCGSSSSPSSAVSNTAVSTPTSAATPGSSSTSSASSNSSNSSAAPAAGTTTITAKDFAFTPTTITVAKGATVTWKNDDTVAHAIADDGGAFNGAPVNPGATFTHTYTASGTFSFHCSIHPSMTGTVTVSA